MLLKETRQDKLAFTLANLRLGFQSTLELQTNIATALNGN